MRKLLKMYITFFRIGLFTFGGGYAMLPMLESEIVEKNKWATDDELMDYYAIGQCTPGVIAVNTATFIGKKQSGILGAIFATLGVISPSIMIITIISAFIHGFSDIKAITHAFGGVRICVCALILDSLIKIGQKSLKSILAWSVFALVLVASLIFDVSAIYLVLAAGVFGLILALFGRKKTDKGKEAENDGNLA